MWPWGHLAVAYLSVVGLTRFERHRPAGGELVALAVGSQFPDLVDKPLAWTFHLLPNGRSLAHSVFVATVVTLAVLYVFRRRDRRAVGIAFAVGYLTHLGGDAVYPAVTGRFAELGFLAWPVVPPIEYATGKGFLSHFAAFELTWFASLQFGLVALALAVWTYTGRPGLAAVTDRSWTKR